MKYVKYTMAVLIVLAIFVAITHFYRESIARGIVNSALRSQGITATELSIQKLATDYVRLSHVVLEQDDGTRYEIAGLSFPLTFPSVKPEKISIEQLVFVPAATPNAPPSLARLLNAFLQLPGSIPNTEISIARFSTPGTPSIENIVWISAGQRQHLSLSVLSVDINVEINPLTESHHEAIVNAVVGDVPSAFSSTLSISRIDTGFSIEGMSTSDLSPWLPTFQSTGLLSDDVVSISAEIDGQVRIEISDDETIPTYVNAHFSVADQITSKYSFVDDSHIQLQAEISEPIRFNFEYPSLDWTASTGQIDINVAIEPVGDVAVQLTDLECSSGIQCMVHVSLDSGPLAMENIALSGAIMSATLTITDDEKTRVDVSSDFTVELTGIESQEFSVASISSTKFSGSQLTIGPGGWHGDIDQIELVLDGLTDRDGIVATLPIAFSGLRILDSGATVDTDVSILPKEAIFSWPGGTIVMPGIRGAISLRGNAAEVSAEVFDDEGALSALVVASHDIETGEGLISLHSVILQIDRGKLSSHFATWPYAWDIVLGTLHSEVEVKWKIGDDGAEYDGTMKYRANEMAGNYDDIVFSGLTTEIGGTFNSVDGITLLPSTITVALLDVGVLVSEITADFSINVTDEAVRVSHVSMSALGGHFVTDPFRFSMRKESNDLVLRPQSIQLQFMIDIAEFEDVEMSGTISGALPMTFREKKLTITNGRLKSDPPGGVVRYLPGRDAADGDGAMSDLGLVSRALANFQYDSLVSNVSYTENGDLKLQMRIVGVNPDMDDKQPVILNLGVENNIPQLLRSLQATRTIEDILERRATK